MDEPVPGPIRVLIAEDQVLLRTSFAALAGAEPDLEVVGRAADGTAPSSSSPPTRPASCGPGIEVRLHVRLYGALVGRVRLTGAFSCRTHAVVCTYVR